MKNYALHIPEGVKDYTGEEAALKGKIQDQVKKVFEGYSYHWVETPTFEYLNVFTTEKAGFQSPSLYKFVNRQGEMLALRSDMTRAIARVIGMQKAESMMPKRYAYMTNSFRYPERYQGKLHEFTQAGVELIGKNSIEADAEVIKLAITALKKVGVTDFTVHIGSSQFLKCTLSDLGLGEAAVEKVYEAIDQKNAVLLKDVLQEAIKDEETLALLLELIECAGHIDLLRSVKKKMNSPQAVKALDEMEQLYELLEDYGVSESILFNFSLLSYGNYYTGMMFQVFTPYIGTAIVEGGRYDHLLEEFGKDLPAVGFGMHMNAILQRLIKQKPLTPLYSKCTLVVANKQTRKICYEVSDHHRESGMVIENSFTDNIEEAKAYAKAVGMGGILHYKDYNKVDVYNLAEGTVQEATINELYRVENERG
ncbi:ATP phosphoribosyltransferase regulatory subunit [Cellulosilyticum sp. WCF-2]|uniref:ATP phosphoribosyltransferase regulatory subunit n=1 Tax=Cellulosilyticum sp. WCF-2 TaxID=2497860 RepID=UPI000F8C54F8|nr:ATP phosphoribosyltransferase regulatory subunit [Cellulosilyticum sp. WCF-2]QEH69644.1 ATP phosphoribosyltransferase regulatory subunit [Cellulosilyticum sp. WCF-2]